MAYREDVPREDGPQKPVVRLLRAEDWRTPKGPAGKPVGSQEEEREKAMERAVRAGQCRGGGGGGPFLTSAKEARERLNRQQREGR